MTIRHRDPLRASADRAIAEAKRLRDPAHAAAVLLEGLKGVRARSEAVLELAKEWVVSPDIYRRQSALSVLREIGDRRAAPAVRSALERPSVDGRELEALLEELVGALEQRPIAGDPVPDRRWDLLDERLESATEMMPALGANETARSVAEHAIGDSDYVGAIAFLTSAVRYGDGRPLARSFAELVIPEVELLVGWGPSLEQSDAIGVQAALGRLRSVVAEQSAGTAVPEEFRAEFEAWWASLVGGGDLDAAVAQAESRLDELPSGSAERHWIHLILTGWLEEQDQWRWQPAFQLLGREGVVEAVPVMRAVGRLAGPEQRPFVDRFDQIADALEASADVEAP